MFGLHWIIESEDLEWVTVTQSSVQFTGWNRNRKHLMGCFLTQCEHKALQHRSPYPLYDVSLDNRGNLQSPEAKNIIEKAVSKEACVSFSDCKSLRYNCIFTGNNYWGNFPIVLELENSKRCGHIWNICAGRREKQNEKMLRVKILLCVFIEKKISVSSDSLILGLIILKSISVFCTLLVDSETPTIQRLQSYFQGILLITTELSHG